MKLKLPKGSFGAYLFDCDGTIADSMPLHYVAWKRALEEWNCDFDEELFYAWGGMPGVLPGMPKLPPGMPGPPPNFPGTPGGLPGLGNPKGPGDQDHRKLELRFLCAFGSSLRHWVRRHRSA